MFRFSSRINNTLSRRKTVSSWKTQRVNQSSQPGSGSRSKGVGKGLIAAAGVSTVISGIVGYSAWSYENRKTIEDSIPGSNYLLDPILGPIEEPPKKAIALPKSDPGLLQKKIEREKAKEKEAKSKGPITLPPPPPLDPPQKTEKTEKSEKKTTLVTKEEKQVPGSEEFEKRLVSSENDENKENANLSQRLNDAMKDAQKFVTDALAASEDASRAVRRHAEKAYEAIDSGEGHEGLYAAAAEVARAKKDLIKTAENKLKTAKVKIQKLEGEICGGKDSKMTKKNETLAAAEEIVSELNYAITKINSSVMEALRDSTAVSEYRDLVEASRTQFEAEVRSLLPDVKIGEKSDKLTQDELNLLLAHAYRKVLALQKALAKQQTVDKERFKDSVLRQREMETKLLDGKLQSELEKQRRDLGFEHRHRLQQLREDLEVELRMQLKRQAAAHSDHLADVLQLQERQLQIKWENKFQDGLERESEKYYKSISQIQGDLYGLKAALKSRADVDKAAHAAQELWLACQSLKTALRLGKKNSRSWEEQLLPLSNQVQSITKAAGEKDPFVKVIISTIPDEALERGVYTEEALRERFLTVDRVCKKVALVGENGGSLLRYFLSYVQSFFLLNSFDRLSSAELRDEEIDITKLDTHDILARTRYCIAKDDLVQAVRYLNLLRGEPRNVASDWLKEAKLALEAKQAANALMAHAASTGARAL